MKEANEIGSNLQAFSLNNKKQNNNISFKSKFENLSKDLQLKKIPFQNVKLKYLYMFPELAQQSIIPKTTLKKLTTKSKETNGNANSKDKMKYFDSVLFQKREKNNSVEIMPRSNSTATISFPKDTTNTFSKFSNTSFKSLRSFPKESTKSFSNLPKESTKSFSSIPKESTKSFSTFQKENSISMSSYNEPNKNPIFSSMDSSTDRCKSSLSFKRQLSKTTGDINMFNSCELGNYSNRSSSTCSKSKILNNENKNNGLKSSSSSNNIKFEINKILSKKYTSTIPENLKNTKTFSLFNAFNKTNKEKSKFRSIFNNHYNKMPAAVRENNFTPAHFGPCSQMFMTPKEKNSFQSRLTELRMKLNLQDL